VPSCFGLETNPSAFQESGVSHFGFGAAWANSGVYDPGVLETSPSVGLAVAVTLDDDRSRAQLVVEKSYDMK
jgi:hypothetical protein